MIKNTKEIGPNHYREKFGRYFEDFNIGDVYDHRPGKTITEYDNHQFTLMTLNTHPIHFDAEYAKHSEFKKPIVNSAFTLALVAGMSVSDISQKTIANLGWDKIKLTAPVYVGDTLYAESVVLSKRESKSRPTQGIVSVRTTGFNQEGKEVICYERTMLIPKKGHAVDDVADY